jgi:hypothetical protein
MQRYAITLVLSFLLTAVVAADPSDLYVVPVAGHAQGANGTAWRTDVVLHNPQNIPIAVEAALIESGRAATNSVVALPFGIDAALVLSPGETRVIADILGPQGRDVTGALIIGADLPFVATSRTYAETPLGRTLGQTVLPIAIAASANASPAVLPALAQSDLQRSNIGLFLAASRTPLLVEITLASPSGEPLGTEVVAVDGEGFAHRQIHLAQIAPGAMNVTATVRLLEGEGVIVPYASIVDNRTAEAIFVSTDAVTSSGASARSLLHADLAHE